MNTAKLALLILGMVFLAFGFLISADYGIRLNSGRGWGANPILADLGFISLGLAFELLGLGLIFVGNAEAFVSQHRPQVSKVPVLDNA